MRKRVKRAIWRNSARVDVEKGGKSKRCGEDKNEKAATKGELDKNNMTSKKMKVGKNLETCH